jgi:hypothetical protein
MTAVEWFLNELKKRQYFIGNDMLEAYNQANELFEQQIKDAYNDGQAIPPFDYAQKYYNETFKNPLK